MTICSCSFTPRSTEERADIQEKRTWAEVLTKVNCDWSAELSEGSIMVILTSVATDAVRQLHIRTKLPHLFDYLTDLQSELVRWRDAKALREPHRLER